MTIVLKRHFIMAVMLLSGAASVSAQTSRQWRDSLAVINRQIETSPYSSDLHLRKAAINIELQQWQYAIDEYGLVLGRDPGNPAALFYRAYAYTHLRRYDLARNDYEDFLKMAPRNMEAMICLAHVYTKLQRPADAIDRMNHVVELFPDSAVAYAARAGLEMDMAADDAALYDWGEACRLAPDNTDYIISKAALLISMGRKKEARAELDKAVGKGVSRGALNEWYRKCK